MKKVLIGIAVIVVVLIAAVFIVPFFIPVETYKEQIAGEVRAATGRDLAIRGDVRFSLLPSLALEANDVSFANAPGGTAKQMVTLAKLKVELRLMPLLSGEVEIASFVLVDPVINLEVDKSGRPNWAFAAAKAPAKAAPAGKPTPPAAEAPAAKGEAAPGLAELRLGDVRLVNGTVRYDDAKSGQKVEISKINLTLSLPGLDRPFAADGRLTWNGKEIALRADVASPKDLLAGRTTKIGATVKSEVVEFDFRGDVTNATPLSAGGKVALDVPSIRRLAAWAAKPIEMRGTGLGPLKIAGDLALKGDRVSFSNATIAVDDIKAKGDFSLVTGRRVPYVSARLEVDRLDLNPYLGGPEAKGAPAPAGKKAAPATGGQPAAKQAGWSDEPIDVSALKAVDADLSLSVKAIVFEKIQVGRSAVKVALKGGRLLVDLTELALYDGKGKGRIVVDGRGKVMVLSQTFELTGVQAQPLLRDAAGFDRLLGTANAKFAVAGRGRSQRVIVSSLNGNGAVTFLNGAVKGINLPAMVRSVSLEALQKGFSGAQQTDFTELSGTFVIKNGILKNDDLTMKSPLLRVAGAGTSDLPNRYLKYRIEPKVVGTLKGQGAKTQKTGLVVPIIVKGPWDDLDWKPDLRAMLKLGPGGIAEKAKALKEGLAAGGAKGVLQKLLPGAGTSGSESTGEQSQDPLKRLKSLLPGLK